VLYLRSSRSTTGFPEAIHYAEFSPDGSRVIGGGAEGVVYIWDSFTGQVLTTINVESRANVPSPPAPPGITLISCVRYNPDGKSFATVSPLPTHTGAMIRIFDIATGAKLREWADDRTYNYPSSETCVYSPDGKRLMVTGVGGGKVFNVADGSEVSTLAGYSATTGTGSIVASMNDGDWHPNGAEIVGVASTSSPVPEVIFSDPVTGAMLRSYTYTSTGSLTTVRYSPDGARFITTSSGGAARVYDAATGALIYDLHDYATFPTAGAFSHDGTRFATTGQDNGSPNWKMRLYDAATGSFIRQVGAIGSGMRSIGFSPDDSRILTACIDGVRIFHAPQATAGSSDVSDSLWTIYIDSNASVVVGAPLVTARQGDVIDVPISISDPGGALGAGATRVNLTLRYNATLLDPIESTPNGTVSGGERSIVLSFPIASAADTVLGVLRMKAALGNDSTTALDIIGVATDNPSVAATDRDGLFRLSDLCREGGARLVNPNGRVALKVVRSAPGGIDVEIETIESGRTRLELCDAAGRAARSSLDGEAPAGRWTAHIELDDLPQGRYYLTLETPTVRKVVPVEVVR
jgi:WD40 repeat protein